MTISTYLFDNSSGLGIGSILRKAHTLFFAHWLRLVSVAVLHVVPIFAFALLTYACIVSGADLDGGAPGILIGILWFVGVPLLLSTYAGAMCHYVAMIYAGETSPSVMESAKRGFGKKWSVFCVVALSFLVLAAMTIVTFARIFTHHGVDGMLDVVFIIAYCISAVCVCGITGVAVPVIVIEGKSPMQAFKRSMNLCKRYFCGICGTLLLVGILFSCSGPFVIIFRLALDPVLYFVLYMSMRIDSENLTESDFAMEMNPHGCGCELPVQTMPAAGFYEKLEVDDLA